MKLLRYQYPVSPTTSFGNLRDEMDRLFDVAFPTLSSIQRDRFFGDYRDELPVDLYQEKDALIVRAEVPGFRKEDLSVEVVDDVLIITGHQKTEAKATDKKDAATKQERRVSRSLALPESLNLDKIEAGYENGVLTVKLPKSEESKPRTIAINVK